MRVEGRCTVPAEGPGVVRDGEAGALPSDEAAGQELRQAGQRGEDRVPIAPARAALGTDVDAERARDPLDQIGAQTVFRRERVASRRRAPRCRAGAERGSFPASPRAGFPRPDVSSRR
ncbi:hypothetical protein [Methylobacterium mesophilicum]|uniref:hypothetical protein n=1 Tax=Methylobacterium mesophilicum TaxID=39956 RepID=UPI002F3592D2